MYQVGTAAHFGLTAYGTTPAAQLPDSEVIALWHNDQVVYVTKYGDRISIDDGHQRLVATTLLLILRDPVLQRWTLTRTRVLTMVPTFDWALGRLDPFGRMVYKRIVQIQKLAGITGGDVDSVIWDWEPGQAVGMVAIQLVTHRVFYRFTLRGHTLAYRDMVSNVTVPLQKEVKIDKTLPRREVVGDLFPDSTEEF